ncbi:MAG: RNA degradosome polyphosphate kinase [Acidimicrobiales bacterium]|nr:RNA degradosome polyphosphate kinase [Acidimicrobiales bacterium]
MVSISNPQGQPNFINRELSWLSFGQRLLDLVENDRFPLLERIKFMAIFATGLDEFFQVRVAGLKDQVAADIRTRSIDGMRPAEQLDAIRHTVRDLLDRQEKLFLENLVPSLSKSGIILSDWSSLDDDDRDYLVGVFENTIFPVLTPLAVDPSHPFPYISNLSLNLAVLVGDPKTGEQRFARVKVPPLLDRFVVMPDQERFVPIEQVIASHLGVLFPDMAVLEHNAFRVTRNADLTLEEDEADDLLEAVEMELRRRRFGRAVRLEIQAGTSSEVATLLLRELEVEQVDVYASRAPLDLGGLWAVYNLDRPDLHLPYFKSVPAARLAKVDPHSQDIFDAIREKDIVIHHPYESFTTSVEAFITSAASDPNVLAIKQTLYRTSGDSPIVMALIAAAESGKQVAVLIELKARFDEQANIGWARQLERAGVHVVYGLVGLKTHCKCALVVRQESDGIKRYCHIGTGNYNSKTARQYEDIGILSADEDLGADLTDLFNFLTGYSRQHSFRKLIVAPTGLRRYIVESIQAEASVGESGRIIFKVNGLTDPTVIEALYRASNAGVKIDLIVRSICSLVPGVEGLSENIRVRSLVGRFLEHSRIFRFGGIGPRSASYLIGSADLMERNLDRRVEAIVPVTDSIIKGRLEEILDLDLKDDQNAWELKGDGSWHRPPVISGLDEQQVLSDLVKDRLEIS